MCRVSRWRSHHHDDDEHMLTIVFTIIRRAIAILAQARRELWGVENSTPPEETPDNADLTEEWNVIASSKGHRAPRPGVEEEETVGEHLVIDGLEEATHDQMLEARREELEQEGGIV